jgi:HK97 family phage prohead protease
MKSKLTIPLEIKALNDGEFEGHGSVFGNEDLGGDIVMPGAFKRTLAKHRSDGSLPQMFWMHDPSRVCGKWLDMSEDENGLRVKGVLAPTPLGEEIRTLLKMDAVRGLSIGYSVADDDYTKDGNRLLKDVELWEVSVVSLPMNPLAQVAHAKSQLSATGEYVPTAKEFERTLRDVGCSRRVAKTILSKVYEGEVRDAPAPEAENEERDALSALKELEDLLIARQIEETFNLKRNKE